MERVGYGQFRVGQIIIADDDEPFTGDNVFPKVGKKYQLVQKELSSYNLTRDSIYHSQGIRYKADEDYRINTMKLDFHNTPPIPEEDDGMHRIVAAKELGYKTILMWKQI